MSNCYSKRIYFDGFLPPAKLDVRLSRLIGLTKRMSDYYYANQTVYLPFARQQDCEASLFGPTSVQTRLTALPPAPFLVPAVLEALQQSSTYQESTFVVPGEADLYCSQFLSQYGGLVLTGDSDLLVHDLGESGKVGFLRDIRLCGSETQMLQTKSYWPAAIARQLSLPLSNGMILLAFEMKMDTQNSFKELVAHARGEQAVKTYSILYHEFCKDYQTLVCELPYSDRPSSALRILQGADPRISEYMLQFSEIAALAGRAPEESTFSSTHVFLPFLIDSPTRTSAWEMSLSVRVLAYSLMNIIVPLDERKTIVNEHRKQTDKSQGRPLQLIANEMIDETCQTLVDMISLLEERFHGSRADQSFWTALAIYQDIDFANTNLKGPTIKLVRQQFSSGKVGKTSSWDVIQLFAQIQACFYSFRILRQILAFVIASRHDLSSALIQLNEQLTTLPMLAELQDLAQIPGILQFVEESKVFEVVCDVLGIAVDVPQTTDKKKAKLAKKKKKREQTAPVQNYTKSNNPFSLLGTE